MKIKLLHESAVVPTRAHYNDAGWDLYSTENKSLYPGERHAFGTGIAVEIPDGWFGLVRPRSGLARKEGIILCSSGVVDSGYRGEIQVVLVNTNPSEYQEDPVTILAGDRIAQMVLIPCSMEEIEVVNDLSDSLRGVNGFGSTGN